MGLGIAKIDQKTIPEQLSDMSLVALNHVGTHPLIGPYHIAPVFRVELRGQLRRLHQVAEHDGELPSFRVGRRRGRNARCDLRGALCLGSRLWCWLRRRSGRGGGFCSAASPHEHSAIFIRGEVLCFDDLCLEGFEILVIQAKPYLEGGIRHSSLPLEERHDLCENVVKGHTRSSPNSASNALVSCKSAVSNPSVNQP